MIVIDEEVDHEEGPSYFYNDRCSILPASSRIARFHKKDIASQPPFLWHHDRLAVHSLPRLCTLEGCPEHEFETGMQLEFIHAVRDLRPDLRMNSRGLQEC